MIRMRYLAIPALALTCGLSFTSLTACSSDDDSTSTTASTDTSAALTNAGAATLGAQGNDTAGSFLDLKTATVYSSGTLSTAYSSIDVIFGLDASTNVLELMSPNYASTSGSFTKISAWTTLNSSIIVDNGTTAMSTQNAVKAAIGSKTTQYAAVVNGHLYAVKLSDGTYGVVKVLSVDGTTNTASVSVTLYN